MCNDDKPILIGDYSIADKWTYTDGYIYYKITMTRTDIEYVPYYLIARIDTDVITCTHLYTQIDAWKDSNGDIWYKATYQCPLISLPIQEMGIISIVDNTFERIYYLGTEPMTEWDPENYKYVHLLFYRQE
jgi:hypothetical protein